jgi:hypothetical protein
MNVKVFNTNDYENVRACGLGKTNPIKAKRLASGRKLEALSPKS